MKSIALVLPVTLILMACGAPPPPEKPQRMVRVMSVGAGNTLSVRDYSGEVRARSESTLGFRIPGKLMTRLVDVGSSVKQGQALAKLDPSDAGLQVTQAEAQRAMAAADLARATAICGARISSVNLPLIFVKPRSPRAKRKPDWHAINRPTRRYMPTDPA